MLQLRAGGGKSLTPGQEWWRNKRFPEIEARAYDLVATHERRFGRLVGCVLETELLVPTVGCSLVYYSDQEREEHHIPADAIGALKPYQRLIFIHDKIGVRGRENQTIGEELGHFVLHAKGVPEIGQQSLDLGFDVPESAGPKLFCRTPRDAFVDELVEPAWMSQEAAFFAACLQMPRDRYRPVAERCLQDAIRRAFKEVRPLLSRRMAPIESKIARIPEADRASWDCDSLGSLMFDTCVVDSAIDLLAREHGGLVSGAAQRRRMVELGLIHDAADLLAELPGGYRKASFTDFMIPDWLMQRS